MFLQVPFYLYKDEPDSLDRIVFTVNFLFFLIHMIIIAVNMENLTLTTYFTNTASEVLFHSPA